MHFSTLSIVVLVSLSSLACVSTHMKQFIGKDVRYIAVEDGPPVNVFDMPDDRRAFQYYWGGGSYVVPTTTTTSSRVQLVGSEAFYSEQKIESGEFMVRSDGCLITYFAEWDSTAEGWIVVDIAYPDRLVC